MRDKLKSVARGSFFMSLEQILAMLLGIVHFALLLRYLGAEGYGAFAIALAVINVAMAVPGNWHAFLARFIPEYKKTGRHRRVLATYFYIMVIKVISSLVTLILITVFAEALGRAYEVDVFPQLLPVLALLLVTESVFTTDMNFLYGWQAYGPRTFFFFIKGVLRLAGLAVVIVGGWDIVAVAWSSVAASAVAAVLAVMHSLFKMLPDVSGDNERPRARDMLRRIVGYNMPLYGANLVSVMNVNSGTLILGLFFPPFLIGLFDAALRTIVKFTAILQSIPNALLPPMAELKAKRASVELWRLFSFGFKAYAIIAAAVTVFIVLFAKPLVVILGGRAFESAWLLLQLLAFQLVFQLPAQTVVMVLYAFEETGKVLVSALVRTVLQWALLIALAATAGIYAAPLANVASYAVALVLLFWLLRRAAPQEAPRVARSASTTAALCAVVGCVVVPVIGIDALMPVRWIATAAGLIYSLLVFSALLFVFGIVTDRDVSRIEDYQREVVDAEGPSKGRRPVVSRIALCGLRAMVFVSRKALYLLGRSGKGAQRG